MEAAPHNLIYGNITKFQLKNTSFIFLVVKKFVKTLKRTFNPN